jgi:hypothetical protein
LNVAFHTLAGLAIGQSAAAAEALRAQAAAPPDADGRREGRRPGRRLAVAVVLALGVFSHGVLDALPHFYPFRGLGDAVATAALFIGWMSMVPRRHWPLLVAACAGAVLPDVIDHLPRDLNRHLGLRLPVLPKLFPWHWPEGTGSLSGEQPLRYHVVSMVNHVIVVSFCAAALWISRGILRRPGARR